MFAIAGAFVRAGRGVAAVCGRSVQRTLELAQKRVAVAAGEVRREQRIKMCLVRGLAGRLAREHVGDRADVMGQRACRTFDGFGRDRDRRKPARHRRGGVACLRVAASAGGRARAGGGSCVAGIELEPLSV